MFSSDLWLNKHHQGVGGLSHGGSVFLTKIDPVQKNGFYVKPRVTGAQFGIKHYAGEVTLLC